MSDLLMGLINFLTLEESAFRSFGTQSNTDALLPLAGTAFEQLHLRLTAVKSRSVAWIIDNKEWWDRLPRWMEGTANAPAKAKAKIGFVT